MLEDLKWNKLPLWCVFKKIYGLSHTYMVMSMPDQPQKILRKQVFLWQTCLPQIASELAKKDPHYSVYLN